MLFFYDIFPKIQGELQLLAAHPPSPRCTGLCGRLRTQITGTLPPSMNKIYKTVPSPATYRYGFELYELSYASRTLHAFKQY
jgi:hypothetical protein